MTTLESLPTLCELQQLDFSAEALAAYPGYFATPVGEALKLSGRKYSANKADKLTAQGNRCNRCPQPILDVREAHFHHTHGRGLGGGKRDDRDGEVLCHACHAGAKIARRARWNPRGLHLVKKGGAA